MKPYLSAYHENVSQAVEGDNPMEARFEVEDTEGDTRRLLQVLKEAGGTVAQSHLKVRV